MADGRIVQSGGPELALEVEQNGYARHPEVGGVMAVPALKLDGAGALLAAWPEPARRGGLGAGRAGAGGAAAGRARRAGAARRVLALHRPRRADRAAGGAGGAARRPTRRRSSTRSTRLRLVFVDGVFAPELSDARRSDGVEIAAARRGAAHRHPLGARALRRARGARAGSGGPAAGVAQHRARGRGRGDPGDRAGGAAGQPRLPARRRGRRRAGAPRDPARGRRRLRRCSRAGRRRRG